jgi:hypothetical protein
VAKLRTAISKHVPEIVDKLVEQAKAGDATSARLLLERVLPPLKAAELPVAVTLPAGSLSEQGQAVVAAVATGLIAPGQAAQLLAGLGAMAKIIETDELIKRIEALEKLNESGKPSRGA